MKNSMKFIAGVVLVLLAFTVAGFGQEEVKVVEGYRIDPPKAGKATRTTKADRSIAVAGQPIAPLATAGSAVTVQGFALPENDKVATQRKAVLTFKGESKPSEVKVKVADEEGYLVIMIQSSFRSGSIAVELLDPKGENRGKYMLKTDDLIVTGDKTSVMEEVSGEMQKDFVNPLKGEWTIRAIPVSAEGTINIMIRQESFPGMRSIAPVEVIGSPLQENKR